MQESWAFMPSDLLPNLKYLPAEGSTNLIPGNSEHEYFVDGSPVVYKSETNNNTYLSFGLRRGGKDYTSGGELTNQYFILNITDYTSPTFTTSISKNVLGPNPADEKLGQSWSTPYFCSIKTGASESSRQEVLLLRQEDTIRTRTTTIQARAIPRAERSSPSMPPRVRWCPASISTTTITPRCGIPWWTSGPTTTTTTVATTLSMHPPWVGISLCSMTGRQ